MINTQTKKENAFKTFMEKMNVAEKSVQEQGYFTEEEVEEGLQIIKDHTDILPKQKGKEK